MMQDQQHTKRSKAAAAPAHLPLREARRVFTVATAAAFSHLKMLGLLAGTALALTLPAAGPASAIAPVARAPAAVPARASLSMGAVGADDFVPDMQRRTIMNLVLLGGAGVPVLWLAGGYIYFLVPPGGGGGGAGVTARDALGADVMAAKWIAANPYPGRALVEGLKGDAHYLIVKEDKTLYDFAINAVCTHLGCVVPFNRAQLKYICPCHGSQYDFNGKVIRGPAPLSLALAHVNDVDGKVVLSPWTETDFRTDLAPWWK